MGGGKKAKSLSQVEVVTNGDNLARIKFSPHPPCAFSEHGAFMLANVLNSERAIQTSVQVVRTFIRLRQMPASNAELARKMDSHEKKCDVQFKVVFYAIRQLISETCSLARAVDGFQFQNVSATFRKERGHQGVTH